VTARATGAADRVPLRVPRRGSISIRSAEPWLYLGPALLWFLVFSAFPLIYTVNMSLRDWGSADQTFIGFANYAEMLGDQSLYHSLRTTVIFAFGAISLSFVLGFAIAVLLANDDLWCKTFFRSILILPYVISDVVVGISFRLMFHPILGVMNYVLGTPGWDWFGASSDRQQVLLWRYSSECLLRRSPSITIGDLHSVDRFGALSFFLFVNLIRLVRIIPTPQPAYRFREVHCPLRAGMRGGPKPEVEIVAARLERIRELDVVQWPTAGDIEILPPIAIYFNVIHPV
jgi:hypothetical protein